MAALIDRTGELSANTGAGSVPDRLPRDWTWLNWALTLLTAPAAMVVMAFALGSALRTGGCSIAGCPDLGPRETLFNVLFYGAAAVAAATMLVSFFTATRPLGIVVALSGWGLLLADLAVLAATFGG